MLKFWKTWSLYTRWEHWNWANDFCISTCFQFHCIGMLTISVPSKETFSKGVPLLLDWIDPRVVWGSMCWRFLGNTGAGAGGSNCWGSFSSCWGERRSSFHIFSVALYSFHGGDFFFKCCFFLSVLTLNNAAFYLFILSTSLFCFPFSIIGSKINAVLLYMYFRNMYCHICSLSCAAGYTRFNVLIFPFSWNLFLGT